MGPCENGGALAQFRLQWRNGIIVLGKLNVVSASYGQNVSSDLIVEGKAVGARAIA